MQTDRPRQARTLPSAFARSAHILGTLLHHGAATMASRVLGTRASSGPRRLRCVIEDLGGTFIKCGQMLSARAELLPPEYRHELVSLRDRATPVPLHAIATEVEAAYGLPLESVFASFSPEPVASASMSQVHLGILHDGRRVAIKVRRPGIGRLVEADLILLAVLARTASMLLKVARDCDVVGVAAALRVMIRNELDFSVEAAHTVEIGRMFGSDPTVVIPRVIEGLVTSNVLVMDFVDGVPLDPEALDAAGLNRSALAAAVIRTNLSMILDHPTFQADPHAGNYLALSGGRLAMLDFGATGTTRASTREALDELIAALASSDSRGVGHGLLRVTTANGPVDADSLVVHLEAVVGPLTSGTFATLEMGRILRDLVNLLRQHHLQLTTDMALVVKAIIACESTAQELDPDICFNSVLIPFLAARSLRPRPQVTDPFPSGATPSFGLAPSMTARDAA